MFTEGDIVTDYFRNEGQVLHIFPSYEHLPAKYRLLRAVWYDDVYDWEMKDKWIVIGYFTGSVGISPAGRVKISKHLNIKI